MGKDQKEKTGRVGRGDVSSTLTTQTKTSFNREFSSGGVVFKKEGNSVLWLVTKSAPSKLFKLAWRLPKGHVDPGEKPTESAVREVREEAGIEAKIIKKIEDVKYVYNHPEIGRVFKVVSFYLMEYVVDLPEGFGEETSEVKWLTLGEAYKLLSYSGEKQTLKKANQFLDFNI